MSTAIRLEPARSLTGTVRAAGTHLGLRILVVAPLRFPLREPYAGGLESHTSQLVSGLARRGHQVTLFAAEGSVVEPGVRLVEAPSFTPSAQARADLAAPPDRWMHEHHAYLDLILRLTDDFGGFDVVHNNSHHHLPVAMSRLLPMPVVTTLHTPPLPWLESAATLSPGHAAYVAVSRHTADSWRHCVEADVIHNGVDTDAWSPGFGGRSAVWTGRIVPEKAPHEAIDAARRADLPLVLAGPVLDRAYAQAEVWPRLGPDVTYAGHLPRHELNALVGGSRVALVTPVWDEPYGLVAAEAMACGTPVAAYARGALAEVVDRRSGRLVAPHDLDGLAQAAHEASRLDRAGVRASALERCSAEAMLRSYEAKYRELVLDRLAS